MKDTDYTFCVSVLKEKENNLLKNEFLNDLTTETSFKAVCDILKERNYPVINPFEIIKREWDFLLSTIPYKDELDFLIVKNDFLNLKGIIKAVVFKKTDDFIFTSPALTEKDLLLKAINERYFFLLPEWLSDIAANGYELFVGTLDSNLFEMYIDYHTLKTMKAFSKKSKSPFPYLYCDEICAVSNIKTALKISQLSRHQKEKLSFDYAFFPCEKLDIEKLKKAAAMSVDETLEYISKTDYHSFKDEFLKTNKISDKFIDEYIFSLTENTKTIFFGIEPVIRYFLYNELTAKNISVILNFKKANKDASFIKERLRKIYV